MEHIGYCQSGTAADSCHGSVSLRACSEGVLANGDVYVLGANGDAMFKIRTEGMYAMPTQAGKRSLFS